MHDQLILAIGAALGALTCHVGVPAAIKAARATGFVDAPTGKLKIHDTPTPYLGGMALFVPFLTATALVFRLDAQFLGILLAGTLAALLGLMDDFGAMKWSVKLLGQAVIVLVLVRAGVQVQLGGLPPSLNLLLTAVWLLAVMNAFNFLDIMDGLAATVSLLSSLFFLLLALHLGNPHMAAVSAVLFGTLCGYLRYSLPKARIFLGDCGSLFLGTVLGALALALDYSELNVWAVTAPVLVLFVPCFELCFTILVRILRGRAPWQGSPDHVALRLRRFGMSDVQVLTLVAATGVIAGCTSVWIVFGSLAPSPSDSESQAAAIARLASLSPWLVAGVALASLLMAAVLYRAPDRKD